MLVGEIFSPPFSHTAELNLASALRLFKLTGGGMLAQNFASLSIVMQSKGCNPAVQFDELI